MQRLLEVNAYSDLSVSGAVLIRGCIYLTLGVYFTSTVLSNSILTNFANIMNHVVETSVFLVHLHCRDFSLFFFLRAQNHKNANKRISDFFSLRCF